MHYFSVFSPTVKFLWGFSHPLNFVFFYSSVLSEHTLHGWWFVFTFNCHFESLSLSYSLIKIYCSCPFSRYWTKGRQKNDKNEAKIRNGEREKSSIFCEEDPWKEVQSICPVITWGGNQVPFAYQRKWQAISVTYEAGMWVKQKANKTTLLWKILYWL